MNIYLYGWLKVLNLVFDIELAYLMSKSYVERKASVLRIGTFLIYDYTRKNPTPKKKRSYDKFKIVING